MIHEKMPNLFSHQKYEIPKGGIFWLSFSEVSISWSFSYSQSTTVKKKYSMEIPKNE
jgi:hypothetical protein